MTRWVKWIGFQFLSNSAFHKKKNQSQEKGFFFFFPEAVLSPGRTQSYEGHSDCLPQISSFVFEKSYQCARPPGGRGRRGIRNQLRQINDYIFSRSLTIYISVSQVPPPCHLPSHTYRGLSRSIITTRVNGQSKSPQKNPPFLISKLNSSCSFFSQLFFLFVFLFHSPQRFVGGAADKAPQRDPVVVFETLTPQTNERSLSWQQEGSWRAREGEKGVMDATVRSDDCCI